LAAPIVAGLIAAWTAALAVTLQTTIAHDYLSKGLLRSVVYVMEKELARFLPPVLGLFVILALIAWFWDRIGHVGIRLFVALLGMSAGLTFFLRVGYLNNRFRFSHYWRYLKREVAGIEIPEALVRWDVWRTNLLITLGAVVIGIVIWLVLRKILVGRSRDGRGRWRALGHPVWIAVAILLVLLPSIGAPALRAGLGEAPNFILISLDTLRADHLGVYGYERSTSPSLDSLAAESILFEWPISQAPTTPISHISIFTSLYPTVHGVTGEANRLAAWRLTLTEYLREAGYRTEAYVDGGFMRGWYGYAQGFEKYDDPARGIARVVEDGFATLDGGLADSPFFLFLHCYDIHSPYDSPAPYGGMFVDPAYDGDFNPTSAVLERIRRTVWDHPDLGHGMTPEDIDFMIARYDGGIRYTDHWMGVLFRGLADRGLLENTWIIITSDHGEEMTEHGSVMHETLYHTVTRVPLIMRPPGPSSPGTRIGEIVELIDIMPTVLDLAGVSAVDEMQGQSLIALMNGGDPEWKNRAFSEFHRTGTPRATTTPSLHVLFSLARGDLEAYAYKTDLLEQVGLQRDSTRADEVQVAFDSLWSWHTGQAKTAQTQRPGTETVIIDAEAEEELRALGYIQ